MRRDMKPLQGRTQGKSNPVAAIVLRRSPSWPTVAQIVAVAIVSIFAPAAVRAQPVLGGFVEGIQAFRIDKNELLGDGDFFDRSYPRSEMRAQFTASHNADRAGLFVRTDVVSDGRKVQNPFSRSDRFDIDLREATIRLNLAQWIDFKVGRQISTWGTGDLIFANDLFAKNWEAFFTGLDDSYLKEPQDLIRLTFYIGRTTIDVLGSPYFTPDELPAHFRMTIFNPATGRTDYWYGDANPAPLPNRTLNNGQAHARIARSIGSGEVAGYGYLGYSPLPQAYVLDSDLHLRYIPVGIFGASVRGPIGSFVSYAEFAARFARRDRLESEPEDATSDIRGFIGAEKSLGSEWTIGTQYYAEWMMDYDEYVAGLPSGAPTFDEVRSTVTLRVTKLARRQTVQLSVFGYWGISDDDWHLRPSVSYDVTDSVKWTVGGSLLDGARPYTMFGQFRGNSNVFTRLRYSF